MSLDGVPYIGPYFASTSGLYVATGSNKWGMTTSMVSAMLLTDLVQEKRHTFAEVFSPSRSIFRPQLAVNGWEAMGSLLIPATRRCPHLGCALKWDPQEHTWDCLCHGFRFTETRKLIDDPATGDLPRQALSDRPWPVLFFDATKLINGSLCFCEYCRLHLLRRDT